MVRLKGVTSRNTQDIGLIYLINLKILFTLLSKTLINDKAIPHQQNTGHNQSCGPG